MGVACEPIQLATFTEVLGGHLDEAASGLVVRAISPLEEAEQGELTTLLHPRGRQHAGATRAALLVGPQLAHCGPVGQRWIHPHPAWALACVLRRWGPPPRSSHPDARGGLHPTAHAHPSAWIADGASVGPFAVVERGARVGAGCEVAAHAVIGEDVVVGDRTVVGAHVSIERGVLVGEDCHVGAHSVLHAGVRLGSRVRLGASVVVGAPGFGWVTSPEGEVSRMPQLGGVRLEDDVEVGALSTIDAGTLSPTVVGARVKLDAHVHVGHNVTLGEGCVVAAQCGFAGSVRIGADTRIGGQAGFADHVRVGAHARVAAKSGVIGDLAAGDIVAGYPAVARARWYAGMARALAPRKPRDPRS